MNSVKKKRLETAGWIVGDAAEFVQLSDEERRLLEIRLSLAFGVRALRERQGLT